ncbi:MAG TPA: hypothetical protein QF433_03635, partial [Candidatus Thalassarchaeaceae archaeon]|nr:hypothetical protein [Candidatus Thalassarchaeaceae archaeon]
FNAAMSYGDVTTFDGFSRNKAQVGESKQLEIPRHLINGVAYPTSYASRLVPLADVMCSLRHRVMVHPKFH